MYEVKELYAVMVVGGCAPRVLHSSYGEALTEAKRLTMKQNATSHVLKVITIVEPNEPKLTHIPFVNSDYGMNEHPINKEVKEVEFELIKEKPALRDWSDNSPPEEKEEFINLPVTCLELEKIHRMVLHPSYNEALYDNAFKNLMTDDIIVTIHSDLHRGAKLQAVKHLVDYLRLTAIPGKKPGLKEVKKLIDSIPGSPTKDEIRYVIERYEELGYV